jgi:hypothetical protein
MRHSRRRFWTSKATHVVCTGVLALTGAVPVAGAASSGTSPEGACRGATVTRDYTAESMTYRLRLDLDGCRWWDGSARNLVIWVSRDDGAGAASRYSMAACEADRGPGAASTTACEVSITLAHAPSETAVAYQGEATWDWKDGPQRASFDTRCTATPGAEARCES